MASFIGEIDKMLLLGLGLVLFFALHLLPTQPAVRDGFVSRLGETTYKGLFSVLSLVALAVIVFGWQKLQVNPGKNPQLWVPPTWAKHVSFLLMIPASIFLVAAYVPSRIRTALKHPMLVAIKTWALAHLIANGDLAGMVLFTSFLLYAVYDRISLKTRTGGLGPLGSAKGGLSGDIIAVVGGLAFYTLMMLWGHQALIGKALIATSFAP
jgi:uncharacterized membrane protein